MKQSVILFICACVQLTRAYDEKFDRIEMEKIVANDVVHRLLNDCILGVVDCGPYWEEVRELAPEIARDRCAHCSPRQRIVVGTYIKATKKNYPETWLKIHNKFKS